MAVLHCLEAYSKDKIKSYDIFLIRGFTIQGPYDPGTMLFCYLCRILKYHAEG